VIYSTLFRFDENYNLVPHLAESYQKTDPSTWVVKLRKDVKWHDGQPLTSEDVKWTIEHVLTDKGAMNRFVTGVKSVEAPDPYTVVVHSEKPTLVASWLYAVYTLPKHYWEANGAVGPKFLTFENVPPIGSGPFKWVDWKPGEYAEWEAFDQFFLGKPKVDRLIIRVFGTPETLIAALKAGEIDAAVDFPDTFVPGIKGISDIERVVEVSSVIMDVYINVNPKGKGHPALLDRNVRLALFHAVDRQYLSEQVHGGLFKAAFCVIPSSRAKYYAKEYEGLLPKFDLDKANKILDDAGYKIGPDGIRVSPKGQPLKFRFWVFTGYPAEVRSAEIIKEWWKKIGVDITVIPMEGGAFWQAVSKPPFDYDLAWWGWTIHDENAILQVFTSEAVGVFSSSGYQNPVYDKMYSDQLFEVDETKRVQIIHDMQKLLVEDCIDLTIFYPTKIDAYWKNRWTGFYTKPDGILGETNSMCFTSAEPVTKKT